MTAKPKFRVDLIDQAHRALEALPQHRPRGTHQGRRPSRSSSPPSARAGQGLQSDRDRQGALRQRHPDHPRGPATLRERRQDAARRQEEAKGEAHGQAAAERTPGRMPASTRMGLRRSPPSQQPDRQVLPAASTSTGTLPRDPQTRRRHPQARTRRTSTFAPTRRTFEGRRGWRPTERTTHGAARPTRTRSACRRRAIAAGPRRMDPFPAVPMMDDVNDGAITPPLIP